MRKSRSSDLQMTPAPSPACTLYALRDQHVLRAPKGPPAKNRPAGPAGSKGRYHAPSLLGRLAAGGPLNEKGPAVKGEAKLASDRMGRIRSGERELRSLGVSCTSCRCRSAGSSSAAGRAC
jgi:hypothetical protein